MLLTDTKRIGSTTNTKAGDILDLLLKHFVGSRNVILRQNDPSVGDSAAGVQTLQALALTSRQFHRAVQPFLYETIFISSPSRLCKLHRTLTVNKDLADSVQSVVFFEQESYSAGEDDADDILHGDTKTKYEETLQQETRTLWLGVTASILRGVLRYNPTTQYDSTAPATRNAVLYLLILLARMPNLKLFRHVGLDKRSTFADILALCINGLRRLPAHDPQPPVMRQLFGHLAEVDISGSACDSWADLILKVRTGPELQILNISYPLALKDTAPGHRYIERTWVTGMFNMRDLRLSSLFLPPKELEGLVERIRGMNALRYDWFPSTPSDEQNSNNKEDFLALKRAVESHKQTLQKLYIDVHDPSKQLVEVLRSEHLVPWNFSSFENVTSLTVPDFFLF